MDQHFVFVGVRPVARVADLAAGEALAKALGADATLFSSADELAAFFSDRSMRTARAHLAVIGFGGSEKERADEIDRLVNDAYKPERDRTVGAKKLWGALTTTPLTLKQQKATKVVGGVKAWVRSVFAERDTATTTELLNNTYTLQSLRTAVGDLKNPKYAGGDVLVLNFDKETDTYVRA
jgi:hypothetical protein